MTTAELKKRAKELVLHAKSICKNTDNWILAWNAIFGYGSPYGKLFPQRDDRMTFRTLPENDEIIALMDALPVKPTGAKKDRLSEEGNSPSGTVSLRMPKSLHAALIEEAKEEGLSLNQLMLTKLAVQLRVATAQAG